MSNTLLRQRSGTVERWVLNSLATRNARDAAARAFAASLRGSEAPEGLAAFAQQRRARWAE
jgi:hypothetical protein